MRVGAAPKEPPECELRDRPRFRTTFPCPSHYCESDNAPIATLAGVLPRPPTPPAHPGLPCRNPVRKPTFRGMLHDPPFANARVIRN